MKKLFFALCVCAGLCACSDDAIDGVSSTPSISLDGNDVYLTVRLNDVGSATRAAGTQDGGYQNGSQAEYTVSDAYFYFYDENGDFVSRAEVWNGGSPTENETGNIEFTSNTVIVLKGLTDTKFPRYMVTVLNEPSDFESANQTYYEPAGTLDEFQVKLSNPEDVGIYDADGNFVMSTSAYNAPTYTPATGDPTTLDKWFFVTPINEANFSLEPIPAETSTPIEVYVERLAAKVGVSSAIEDSETLEDGDGNEHTVYRLEESIAGAANADDVEVQLPDGTEAEGTDHLYVEFLGWALNGTARYSNIVKDITGLDAENGIQNLYGGTETYWNGWNVATDFRSYWGKSFNYGIDHNYPTANTTENTDADEDNSSTWLDDYLKYTSLFDGTESDGTTHTINALGGYEYCAENTNDPEILMNKRSSGITNALVKAQIWTDGEDGTITQGNVIRFEGMLFTESAFQEYIARRVGVDTYLSNYYWSPNTTAAGGLLNPTDFEGEYTLEQLAEAGVQTDEWEDLDYSMLTLEDEGNGLLYIELNESFDQSTTLFWYHSNADDPTADALYTIVPATEITTAFEAAREELADLNEDYEINGYADGLMYYAIPIEHLNTTEPTYSEPMLSDEVLINEGNYGIVRNHWYELSIQSLANVGKGIWNEEEVIIPDPTDPISYYIEASLNILSWKMVSQGVDL